MNDLIRIFIGYDDKQHIAYNVLQHSIVKRASKPVSITPVRMEHIDSIAGKRGGTTKFVWSRFAVPWLCNYQGWALFLDTDQVVISDIAELWAMRDESKAVQCVQHSYGFPRRLNWASMMIMNCAEWKQVTPDYIASSAYDNMHGFQWLPEEKVGRLPFEWNYLTGRRVYAGPECPPENAKLIHYTDGGPWFKQFRDVLLADKWMREYEDYIKLADGAWKEGLSASEVWR